MTIAQAGFTAAFFPADGETVSYHEFGDPFTPAAVFSCPPGSQPPAALSVIEADAQLAVDGYVRTGDLKWTGTVWACPVWEVLIPAGIQVTGNGFVLTAHQAVLMLAAGRGITVTQAGDPGMPASGMNTGLLPAGAASAACVHVAGMDAHSPELASARAACCALAADLAGAACQLAAAQHEPLARPAPALAGAARA